MKKGIVTKVWVGLILAVLLFACVMSFFGCAAPCVCDGRSDAFCPVCGHYSYDCPRFKECALDLCPCRLK